MEDSFVLHLLKEIPAWVVLAPLFFVLLLMVYFGHFESETTLTFLQRITDGTLGALLLSLNTRRGGGTTVNADTVQTPIVSTQSMDNSTINAENVGSPTQD